MSDEDADGKGVLADEILLEVPEDDTEATDCLEELQQPALSPLLSVQPSKNNLMSMRHLSDSRASIVAELAISSGNIQISVDHAELFFSHIVSKMSFCSQTRYHCVAWGSIAKYIFCCWIYEPRHHVSAFSTFFSA